jgi:glycosyltransferase involved in cell wall biosynthesis
MEQTLGQVTHTQNFQYWVARNPEIEPTWILITFDPGEPWSATPLVRNNWTLRASLQARTKLSKLLDAGQLDGLFFHTFVTALFGHHIMTKIPTVVSMDATPLNLDAIGSPYEHTPSRYRWVEALKHALTRRTFDRARELVVWHEWGKRSLVADYGAPAEKVAVIPPGIDLDDWPVHRAALSGRVRLLFVGGDFRRKGGELLLSAFRSALMQNCELDIVTREEVKIDGLQNVRIHRGLPPNSPQLKDLFARAHICVFPTLADMLPLAVMEAMASGIPVVTTSVGAIAEQIEDGVTGFLVPPEDVETLARTTVRLVNDQDLRLKMGAAAREVAGQRFSGATNYAKLLSICKRAVDRR